MKNSLIFVLLSAFIISCTPKNDSEITTHLVETDESTSQHRNDANQNVVGNFDNSVLPEGNFSSKYPNGTTKTEGVVLNGKRSGLWTSYHPNGIKQSENTYVNGILNGKTVVYHPNGQVMYIGYYKNGKYDGSWIYFSKEGEELKSVSFKNGKQL